MLRCMVSAPPIHLGTYSTVYGVLLPAEHREPIWDSGAERTAKVGWLSGREWSGVEWRAAGMLLSI